MAATLDLVADFWRERGWGVTVRPTEAPGHATTLAQEAAAAGHRLVLAAGGDGTLGEVANGLVGTETALAPLPVGTANSFAKELRLPLPGLLARHRLLQVCQALVAGNVQQMDVGYQRPQPNGPDGDGGRYWLLWAGTGADGFVVSEVEPRPKWSKMLGPVGYALQGLTVAPRLPRMQAHVTIDGRSFTDEFALILISNCRLYAGGEVLLNPAAYLDDGRFEVWLFHGAGLSDVAYHLAQALRGRHLADRRVTMLPGQCLTVETDPPLPCQTDGDKAGFTPFACEIKPRALSLLAPDTAPDDLFRLPGAPLRS